VNFVIRDIKKVSHKDDLSKPVTFDDNNEDEETTKVNEPVILSWEELVSNSLSSSIFNLLWKISFTSSFITTNEFKVNIITT